MKRVWTVLPTVSNGAPGSFRMAPVKVDQQSGKTDLLLVIDHFLLVI